MIGPVAGTLQHRHRGRLAQPSGHLGRPRLPSLPRRCAPLRSALKPSSRSGRIAQPAGHAVASPTGFEPVSPSQTPVSNRRCAAGRNRAAASKSSSLSPAASVPLCVLCVETSFPSRLTHTIGRSRRRLPNRLRAGFPYQTPVSNRRCAAGQPRRCIEIFFPLSLSPAPLCPSAFSALKPLSPPGSLTQSAGHAVAPNRHRAGFPYQTPVSNQRCAAGQPRRCIEIFFPLSLSPAPLCPSAFSALKPLSPPGSLTQPAAAALPPIPSRRQQRAELGLGDPEDWATAHPPNRLRAGFPCQTPLSNRRRAAGLARPGPASVPVSIRCRPMALIAGVPRIARPSSIDH